jgi:hypothetical protein
MVNIHRDAKGNVVCLWQPNGRSFTSQSNARERKVAGAWYCLDCQAVRSLGVCGYCEVCLSDAVVPA